MRAAIEFWWKQPPRRHGEVDVDRRVGVLELFYDLVYVVLVTRAARIVIEDLSWHGVARFAVMFSLLVLAWQNGTLFHDLHGREDGRSRQLVFAQMPVLVLLSVYTTHAFEADGRGFAIAYVVYLFLQTLQWWSVRRIDETQYQRITGRFLLGMVMIMAAMAASAFATPAVRFWVWLVVVLGGTVGAIGGTASNARQTGSTFWVTDALVERCGLFIIIVLGDSVVAVANTLYDADHRSVVTIVTGIVCLHITFGLWWTYFDTTKSSGPRNDPPTVAMWFYAFIPLCAALAATGAGMVLLIEAADAARAPARVAWLLSGSVAVIAIATSFIASTLEAPRRRAQLEGTVPALRLGAAVALAVPFVPGPPWLTAALLAILLFVLWLRGFYLIATRVPAKTLTPPTSIAPRRSQPG